MYLKTEGDTYLSNSKNFYYGIQDADLINFNKYGLNYGKIKFKIRTKKGNANSKGKGVVIKITDYKKVSLLSDKNRKKIEEDILNSEIYNKNKKELSELYQKKIDDVLKEEEELKEREDNINKRIQDFKKIPAKSLNGLEQDEIIYILNFKSISTKYGEGFILHTTNEEGKIRNFYADSYNKKICGKNKNKSVSKYTGQEGEFYGGKDIDKTLYTLKKVGDYWTNGHKTNKYKVGVMYKNFSVGAKREGDRLNAKITDNYLTIDYINEGNLKTKDSRKMEDLTLNKTYTINKITPITYRKRERYILGIVGEKDTYLSNYWTEKALKEKDLKTLKYAIDFKTLKFRNTPNRNKEMWICLT